MNYLYRLLERKGPVKEYVSSIRSRMSILFPENVQRIEAETKKRVLRNLAGFLGVMFLLCSFDTAVYWIFLCAVAGLCMMSVWEKTWEWEMNLKILKELQSFINDLSFAFRCRNSLEEAFWEVLLDVGGLMKMHGEFLYEMISGSRYEENYRRYKEIAPNEYFLLFYMLSHMTRQEGDTLYQGKSLYGENLKNLSRDIGHEILYLEKTRHGFAGLLGICLLPVFVIKPVEIWATINLPALQRYYESVYGKMQTLVLMLLAIGLFRITAELKYPVRRKNRRKGRILRGRSKRKAQLWLAGKIQKKYGYYLRLWKLLKKARHTCSLTEFLAGRYICALVSFAAGMLLGWSIRLPIMAAFLFAAAAAAGGYAFPLLEVKGRILLLRGSISDEIIRFYTITGMCCRQENMDVYTLLLHLELLAVYYEQQLAETVDTYEGSGLDELEKLKEESEDKAFVRLVEGLMACDEMPVSEAMEFAFWEREYQAEHKWLKDERRLADRSALARFLSFIPFSAVILIKLILPFVMEGLRELEMFNSNLNLLM